MGGVAYSDCWAGALARRLSSNSRLHPRRRTPRKTMQLAAEAPRAGDALSRRTPFHDRGRTACGGTTLRSTNDRALTKQRLHSRPSSAAAGLLSLGVPETN